MDENTLFDFLTGEPWNIPEGIIRKILQETELSPQEIFTRIKASGIEEVQDLPAVFPEIRMTLAKLRERLPDAVDLATFKPLVYDALQDIRNPEERIEAETAIIEQARKTKGLVTPVKEYMKLAKSQQRETQFHIDNLDRDEKDLIRPTIANYKTILQIASRLCAFFRLV